MAQIKITNTEDYFDDLELLLVCRGLLILIEISEEEYINNPNQAIKLIDRKFYKPIILSDTEPLGVDEKYFNFITKNIETYNNVDYGAFNPNKVKFCGKVLALPQNFSEKYLQDIVNGDLRDRDKVFLKAWDTSSVTEDKDVVVFYDGNWHIKLFKCK